MLPCLRGFRLLAAAEPKLAQSLRLASVLQDASYIARERSTHRGTESNYFPNLVRASSAYFAATGSAVVVTTGVPCATGTVGSTGGGSATGTRTCSVAPGAVPAGTVIRTVEPSDAFASTNHVTILNKCARRVN